MLKQDADIALILRQDKSLKQRSLFVAQKSLLTASLEQVHLKVSALSIVRTQTINILGLLKQNSVSLKRTRILPVTWTMYLTRRGTLPSGQSYPILSDSVALTEPSSFERSIKLASGARAARSGSRLCGTVSNDFIPAEYVT